MTSRKLARGLAAAALVGLTLAGCGANPGAAAVVDGEQITESHVAEAVSDFSEITGQPVDASAMLSTLIVSGFIIDVAKEYGVAVSAEQASALLDQQVVTSGTPLPEEDYSEGVLDIARIALVQQALATVPGAQDAQTEIAERIAAADVEVSPRYGDFDPRGSIVPPERPWIAAPAAPAAG